MSTTVRFVVRSRQDPAFPKRTNHYVWDTHQCAQVGSRTWQRRHLAQADADRRNAKFAAWLAR